MKYELIKIDISSETSIMKNIIEVINEVETIIGQEPTDEYEVDITIGLKHLDNFIPPFSKTIIVKSNNNQTGFEIDEQREQAIQDYLNLINQ